MLPEPITNAIGEQIVSRSFDAVQKSEWAKVILDWFKKKRKIYVFGISGSGKTQFIHSLMGELAKAATQTTITNRIKVELPNYLIYFSDTPGHDNFDAFRKKAIHEINSSVVEGIST